MSKRGRKPEKITLTTGNDPGLWRYKSLTDALNDSVALLASLMATTSTTSQSSDSTTESANKSIRQSHNRD